MTSVWVSAKYQGGTRETYQPLVAEAMDAMEFPFGYSWTFGQWQQRQKEQSQEFYYNLGLALLLVFAVMAGLFESVRQAIALMISRLSGVLTSRIEAFRKKLSRMSMCLRIAGERCS